MDAKCPFNINLAFIIKNYFNLVALIHNKMI